MVICSTSIKKINLESKTQILQKTEEKYNTRYSQNTETGEWRPRDTSASSAHEKTHRGESKHLPLLFPDRHLLLPGAFGADTGIPRTDEATIPREIGKVLPEGAPISYN